MERRMFLVKQNFAGGRASAAVTACNASALYTVDIHNVSNIQQNSWSGQLVRRVTYQQADVTFSQPINQSTTCSRSDDDFTVIPKLHIRRISPASAACCYDVIATSVGDVGR